MFLEDATFLLFEESSEAAWQELLRSDPDLLITADAMPVIRGEEIVRRLLDREVKYPIIATSAFDPTEEWVREYANRGLNIRFLAMPWTSEDLRKLLDDSLKMSSESPNPASFPSRSRQTGKFRIVVVDNEETFLEMVELAILAKFKSANLQAFQDSNKGWLELSRSDPDLLIVGGVMGELNGDEIVQRLVDRKIAYPIIVVSGYPPTEKWVQEYTDKNPKITFLRKPFTMEQLYREISKYLRANDNSQPQFRNTEP